MTVPADVAAAARALCRRGERRLLGITGPPGAGKSTLSAQLVASLGFDAVIVPMDGFHLAQAELERLGRAERKGAPDTFDAAGFVTLLERLRRGSRGDVVYAPAFRREIEEPIAGAIAVAPDVPLVIVEGNYLLAVDGAWAGVRPLLDEVWYVAPPDDLRVQRLIERHVAFGRSPDAAREWVLRSDEANARYVAATRARADRTIVFADGTTPTFAGVVPA